MDANFSFGKFRRKIKVLFLDRLKCQELKTSRATPPQGVGTA